MPCTPQPSRNPLACSAGSLLGDNPSEWAFRRVGQIHMGRAKPFLALVADLTADEHLLFREPLARGADRPRRPQRPIDATRGTSRCPGWHLEGLLYRGRRPVSATASPLSARLFFSRFIRHNVPVESKPCCAASPSSRSSSGGILKRHLMCLVGISPRNLQANFD